MPHPLYCALAPGYLRRRRTSGTSPMIPVAVRASVPGSGTVLLSCAKNCACSCGGSSFGPSGGSLAGPVGPSVVKVGGLSTGGLPIDGLSAGGGVVSLAVSGDTGSSAGGVDPPGDGVRPVVGAVGAAGVVTELGRP